jgi:hypothetical protein
MAHVIMSPPDLIPLAQLTHECGALVEFVQSDIQTDQRGESYVVCPWCKKPPWIDVRVLRWQNRVLGTKVL